MATAPSESAVAPPRRVVLVDFDWQDADLFPDLFRHPDVAVRLVAGERAQDAGLRVAEMCGLPRTMDLADLTREIFDLALVSERSSRRTQLESLLLALGTPCQTPQDFLRVPPGAPDPRPTIEAPLTLHAAAFEQSLGGALEDAVDRAIPDLAEQTPLAPRALVIPAHPRIAIDSLDDFPSHESRSRLEAALKDPSLLPSISGSATTATSSP